MKHYGAIVIGGGILGCMTARNLRRYNISVLLLEKEDDVCRGITRANSAIVYAGYDNQPGSRKAALTVRGNANMEKLCEELEVPFSRCGSLLVTYEAASIPRLRRKLEQGRQNGVPGLRLLTGPEAEAMEPMLKKGVAAALYAPTTGTVNPWLLGVAAWENALQNGAAAMLNTEVVGIGREADGYVITTDRGEFGAKAVFNCAGLSADKVQELAFPPSVRLKKDSAEYLVFDSAVKKPERVIFLQAASCGKGITAIPCVEGNLLISGVRKPLERPFATTREGLEELRRDTKALLPQTDGSGIIRSFGAVRPNPYRSGGGDIHDFTVENPGPGFYSLIGIKTPGLTASNELGILLAEEAARYLKAEPNPAFDPRRPAIRADDGEILCYCGRVTRGAVLQAIARGAATVEAVKRRLGTGMGPCQGSRCGWRIAKILKETGVDPNPIF